jgi:hypothetical protein
MDCIRDPSVMPRKFAWFYDGKDSTCTSRPSQCPPPVVLPEPDPCPQLPPVQPLQAAPLQEAPYVPSDKQCETPCGCPNEVYGYPTTGPAEFCTQVASSQCGEMDPRNPRWQRKFRSCMVGASGVAGHELYAQDGVESMGSSTEEQQMNGNGNGRTVVVVQRKSWLQRNWLWVLIGIAVLAGAYMLWKRSKSSSGRRSLGRSMSAPNKDAVIDRLVDEVMQYQGFTAM